MKKTITANDFTPIYDTLEDRIRLVLNYQDINNRVDFMITRSFLLNLIPTAEEFIEQSYGTEDVVQEKVAVAHVNEPNKALNQTDTANLELFKKDEELLLEVNFAFNKQKKITKVAFSSKTVVVNAQLNASTIREVFKMIKLAIPRIRWGIAYNF